MDQEYGKEELTYMYKIFKTLKENRLLTVLIIAIIILSIISLFPKETNYILIEQEIEPHAHADFKIYILDNEIVFSEKHAEKDSRIHLHIDELNASVIHSHSRFASIGLFLKSIGIVIEDGCITYDKKYCESDDNRLRFFVNNREINNINDYFINDIDRILITYGEEKDIEKQATSVTNLSCVYSNKCQS